jgi:regulator of protease activity HflC (stomatin/prohibitin superfamily)
MIREKELSVTSGYLMLVLLFGLAGALVYAFIRAMERSAGLAIAGCIVGFVVVAILFVGFFVVNPNEGRVLQIFGKYVGTCKEPGLRWANPFYSKRTVSLRVRSFETGRLKVNDNRGNPIEIAAVVVWKVVDTAEAVFEVDDYMEYILIQSEAAVRGLATGYPYDGFEEKEVSLVGNITEISDRLRDEAQARLQKAGIKIVETRISHLAYAPEIAQSMLRRQQAAAVIAARRKIVEGAVGMVQNALELLAEHKVVDLDEERRAAMVSNLLVVLCSEHEVSPVINAGTLYG